MFSLSKTLFVTSRAIFTVKNPSPVIMLPFLRKIKVVMVHFSNNNTLFHYMSRHKIEMFCPLETLETKQTVKTSVVVQL